MRPFSSFTDDDALVFLRPNYHHPYRDKLADMVGSRSLIDLGCGPGVRVRELYDKEQYTGYDCSAALVRRARRDNPGYEFHVHDITTTPAKTAECCLMASVLEHMENDRQALAAYNAALDVCDELIILWHTPPGPTTEITVVRDEQTGHEEHQNVYAESLFGGPERRVERLGPLTIWVVGGRRLPAGERREGADHRGI